MASVFQLERNGAFLRQQRSAPQKAVDTADIVREAISRQWNMDFGVVFSVEKEP